MKPRYKYAPKPTVFPAGSINDGDFPLNSRVAKYALALFHVWQETDENLTKVMFSVLPRSTVLGIYESLAEAVPMYKDNLEQLREGIDEADDAEDLARAFCRFFSKRKSRSAVKVFKRDTVSSLQGIVVNDRSSYRRRVAQLCGKMNLGPEEIAIIELGCCYTLNNELERMLDDYNIIRKTSVISLVSGLPHNQVSRIMSNRGLLAKSEILEVQDTNINVQDDIFNYLIGNAGKDFAANSFTSAKPSDIEFSAFDLNEVQRNTLIRMIDSAGSANILFYGKPGTGKTEIAKALATVCGKKAVFVSCGSDGDQQDRKTALLTTINSVSEDTLVIVDEVDALLNTESLFRQPPVNKSWINNFLDTSRHKILWISNNTSRIEESVRRRFAYSLKFKQLKWQQRENIWNTQLRKQRIKRHFPQQKIQQLSKVFAVTPGLIAYAAKTVARCRVADMPAGSLQSMLEEILTRQMELTEGRKPTKNLDAINKHYDPAALNTDTDTIRLLQGLENFQGSEADYGMNLLFWGWPGTGKTEFGKYIAERLGKELLVKRMSDLQSMWVGETEKQIARAFQQAEEEEAILFLDEADSLFINRQTAHRSWETSQTNEILTQMENFAGILICCTNLLEHLDEAAMRRFAFKIKFLPLTDEGKLRLYRKYFNSVKGKLTLEQEAQLSNVRNLCPGDIKAVWQRMRFFTESSHDQIIKELEKEVQYKKDGSKQPIGF